MSSGFDPLSRLITSESIRFIGTIGDIATDAVDVHLSVVGSFMNREVRTSTELIASLRDARGCKRDVAGHTIEVCAALQLIVPVGLAGASRKKYVIGDFGRVANALRSHTGWGAHDSHALVMARPMLNANGDYLLQTLQAIDSSRSKVEAVAAFRDLLTQLVDAKLSEIPQDRTGSKWDAYRSALRSRRTSLVAGRRSESSERLTLEELQKRRLAERALIPRSPERSGNKDGHNEASADGSDAKTFQHHFDRCRAWLESLGWIAATDDFYRVTERGHRVIEFVSRSIGRRRPVRIPPNASTLQDCFRLSTDEIAAAWGVVVDDSFWEECLLAAKAAGYYTPTDAELLTRFNNAFDAVRVSRISEAAISAVRQVMFLGWLLEDRPVRSSVLESAFFGAESIPSTYPSRYGYGRNRQGRLAYLFRKGA